MNLFLESFWFLVLYPVLLLLSIAGGYFVARKQYVGKDRSWKASGTENAIISFYGLLLSFSLYSSGNSYRERTSLVHQHVDALGSIYREGSFSNDSLRPVVNDWVKAILTAKIKYHDPDTEQEILQEHTTDSLYNGLLVNLRMMHASNTLSVASERYYIDKINTAIALDYRIQYSGIERTPTTVIVLLIVGSFLVGLLIGFTNGFNQDPHVLVPAIFFLLTTLTISTILDMDSPSFGIIRPSYSNYENMLRSIAD